MIVGGFETFCIVNIDKCVIERTIEDKALGGVNCIIKLRDGNTIICGCNDNNFCFYDMNTKKYKIIDNRHKDYISDLLFIDNNTFYFVRMIERLKCGNINININIVQIKNI